MSSYVCFQKHNHYLSTDPSEKLFEKMSLIAQNKRNKNNIPVCKNKWLLSYRFFSKQKMITTATVFFNSLEKGVTDKWFLCYSSW